MREYMKRIFVCQLDLGAMSVKIMIGALASIMGRRKRRGGAGFHKTTLTAL